MGKFHVVYLTGAPASGKSSTSERIASTTAPLKLFRYSKELRDHINQKNVGTRFKQDELRRKSAGIITVEDVAEVDKKLIDFVRRYRRNAHIIIDSHAVTKEDFGFRVTPFSLSFLRKVRPTIIFTLFAEPSVILQRIKRKSQGRQRVSNYDANVHNQLQASVALIYSIELGLPSYYLDTSKPLETVVEQIVRRLIAINPNTKILD